MKLSDINETPDYKDRRHDDDIGQERPWRKDATPLTKPPVNPDYPTKPFNHDEWMKVSSRVLEDNELPEVGDTIRTKKMQMDGKVEKLGTNAAGYPEVFFRIEDGRLMKTPVDNVVVVQKLADEDMTEGGMGGINQCAPSNDVSYEDVLDEVRTMWEDQINELSVDKMKAYVSAAKSSDNFKNGRSLGKIARSASTGVPTAQDKINAKTGNRTGSVSKYGSIRQGPAARDIDESDPCWKDYKQVGMKDKNGKQVPNCVPVEEKNMPGELPVDSSNDQSPAPAKQSAKIPAKTPDKIDPWNGNPKKLAKAPKGTMQGKDDIRFSELVKDTIEAHGINDAFEYYVKKHGLSPRQFAIFAGLNATPVSKPRVKGDWTDPSITTKPKPEGWWKKMRGKLPFEE